MKACLFLLGPFRLEINSGSAVAPIGKKARALLAMLALAPNGTLQRKFVADLLWNKPTDRLVNLRQLLSDLSKCLKAHKLEILKADRETLTLDLESVSVDLFQLESFAQSAELPGNREIAAIDCGDFLSAIGVRDETFTDWLEEQRAYVRRAALLALNRLLAKARAANDLDLVEVIAHRILRLEPASEDAFRTLMRVSAERGDKGAALAHFNACAKAMRLFVDADVDQETEQLMRMIQEGAIEVRPQQHEIISVENTVGVRFPQTGDSGAIQQIGDTALTLRVNPIDCRSDDLVEVRVARYLHDAIKETLTEASWMYVVIDDATGVLPVDYELSASLHPDRDKARLWVQLIRSETRKVIWARHLDSNAGDSFVFADQVAAVVSSALERELIVAEVSSAWRKPAESLDDRGRMMRAVPLIFRLTRESLDQADDLLKQVMKNLPGAPAPMAWRGVIAFIRIGQGWFEDIQELKEELDFLTRRSIEVAPDNVLALSVAGHVSSFVQHRYSRAIDLFERATQVHPNNAYAWGFSALTFCYIGDMDEAKRRFQNYRRVWPLDPYSHFFNTARCISESMRGRHDSAVDLAKRTLADNRNFNATFRPLISSLGHLGRQDEAEKYILELRAREPGFSMDWFRQNYPPLQSQVHKNYVTGFAKAGLPKN